MSGGLRERGRRVHSLEGRGGCKCGSGSANVRVRLIGRAWRVQMNTALERKGEWESVVCMLGDFDRQIAQTCGGFILQGRRSHAMDLTCGQNTMGTCCCTHCHIWQYGAVYRAARYLAYKAWCVLRAFLHIPVFQDSLIRGCPHASG